MELLAADPERTDSAVCIDPFLDGSRWDPASDAACDDASTAAAPGSVAELGLDAVR